MKPPAPAVLSAPLIRWSAFDRFARLAGPLAPPVAVALVLAATAAAVPAQSLVEVARRERLRREAIARQAGPDAALPRVYTDADLVYSGRLTTRVGDAGRGAAAETGAVPEPGAAPAESGAAPTPPPDAEADERQWRDRMTAARRALERAERRAAELQTRANGLWADFTGRDDPAQRAALEQERRAALTELEATRAETEKLARAVADVRDEARRAGIPPGWLRPRSAARESAPAERR